MLKKAFKKIFADEEGATMTEYILLVILIAVALIAIVQFFRGQVARRFQEAGNKVGTAR